MPTLSTTAPPTPSPRQVNGVPIRDLRRDSLRSAVAVVPQDTVLFNDTILQNIRYGRPDASDEEVMDAARMAHLHGARGPAGGWHPGSRIGRGAAGAAAPHARGVYD